MKIFYIIPMLLLFGNTTANSRDALISPAAPTGSDPAIAGVCTGFKIAHHPWGANGENQSTAQAYTFRNDEGYFILDSTITLNHATAPEGLLTAKTEHEYDAQGNMVLETRFSRDQNNDLWLPAQKLVSAFDAQGNQTLWETYNWDSANNDWRVTAKSEWEFNAQGKLKTTLIYKWNNVDFNWLPEGKIS
jgi:hypothetical protein